MERVVLITGSGSGIGLASAVKFAEGGDHVVATLRASSSDEALRAAATAAGAELDVRRLDVTDPDAVAALTDSLLAERGRIDVVVANAGRGFHGTLEELSLADLHDSMAVNFFGVAALTKAVLPSMRAAGQGRIIAVTSLGGVVGQPFNDAYCAAKFAVEGLYESLQPVAARFGVHVSIVEPGPVLTGFRGNSTETPSVDPAITELRETYMRNTNTGRGQHADDVAEVVVAVADDPAPKLRYQSSSFTTRLAGTKVADLDGDRVTAMTGSWLDPPAPSS